jgi:hypothetical protein
MTKRIPLDRLREISRRRSTRSATMPGIRSDEPEQADSAEPPPCEWPVRPSFQGAAPARGNLISIAPASDPTGMEQ